MVFYEIKVWCVSKRLLLLGSWTLRLRVGWRLGGASIKEVNLPKEGKQAGEIDS